MPDNETENVFFQAWVFHNMFVFIIIVLRSVAPRRYHRVASSIYIYVRNGDVYRRSISRGLAFFASSSLAAAASSSSGQCSSSRLLSALTHRHEGVRRMPPPHSGPLYVRSACNARRAQRIAILDDV